MPDKREDQLNQLWNRYRGTFQRSDLNTILEAGFVLPINKVADQRNILICGINPSMRLGTDERGIGKYSYSDLRNSDLYFKPIDQIIRPLPAGHFITYTDLFYLRITRQIKLNMFLTEERGRSFLKEQLKITEDYITDLKPKLVIVFNRGSQRFWNGKEPSMNFEMSPCKMGAQNLYMANNSRIKFPIWFSRYLKYINSGEKEKIRNMIQLIYKYNRPSSN